MTTSLTLRAAGAIFLSCLLAGALDIGAAMLLTIARNAPVQSMLKAIASGVLGAAAFKGGEETALFGLGLHFLIMLGIALVYWWLVSGTPLARAQPLVAGALFGAAVYAAMNLLVLPLSRIAFVPHYPPMTLVRDIAIHIACVGIPIALVMKTMLRR
jgi:hypothetical protein